MLGREAHARTSFPAPPHSAIPGRGTAF